MMHYLWWIPTVLLVYALTAILSVKNQGSEGLKIWFWLLCVPIPFWAIVSKLSKRLVFDALLYDLCLLVGMYVTLYFVGAMDGFKPVQYIGVITALVGLFMMRV